MQNEGGRKQEEGREEGGKVIRKIGFQMKCRNPVSLLLESVLIWISPQADFETGIQRSKLLS